MRWCKDVKEDYELRAKMTKDYIQDIIDDGDAEKYGVELSDGNYILRTKSTFLYSNKTNREKLYDILDTTSGI